MSQSMGRAQPRVDHAINECAGFGWQVYSFGVDEHIQRHAELIIPGDMPLLSEPYRSLYNGEWECFFQQILRLDIGFTPRVLNEFADHFKQESENFHPQPQAYTGFEVAALFEFCLDVRQQESEPLSSNEQAAANQILGDYIAGQPPTHKRNSISLASPPSHADIIQVGALSASSHIKPSPRVRLANLEVLINKLPTDPNNGSRDTWTDLVYEAQMAEDIDPQRFVAWMLVRRVEQLNLAVDGGLERKPLPYHEFTMEERVLDELRDGGRSLELFLHTRPNSRFEYCPPGGQFSQGDPDVVEW